MQPAGGGGGAAPPGAPGGRELSDWLAFWPEEREFDLMTARAAGGAAAAGGPGGEEQQAQQHAGGTLADYGALQASSLGFPYGLDSYQARARCPLLPLPAAGGGAARPGGRAGRRRCTCAHPPHQPPTRRAGPRGGGAPPPPAPAARPARAALTPCIACTLPPSADGPARAA